MAILNLARRIAGGATLAALQVLVPSLNTAAIPAQEPSPSFRQLSEDVRSPDARVRRAAARALADTRSAEALAPLAQLIGDPERGLREEAIAGVLGVYVSPPPRGRVANAQQAFELAPFRVTPWTPPPGLTPALVAALGDDWWFIRRDAVYALGVITVAPVDDRLAFELMQSLTDREPAVRRAAAQVPGQLGVAAAGTLLVGAINDDDLGVRLAAMRAVGELRERRAVQALTDQLEFYQRGVAGRAALDAIALVADPTSVPLFEAYTSSGNDAHRRSAYEGLARVGGVGTSAPAIEVALGAERNRGVAAAMTYALVVGGRLPLEQLAQFLVNRDTADAARAYLVEIGRARPGAVAALAQHPDAIVREQVALVLGVVGGPDATAALRAAVDGDGSEDVRRVAGLALGRLQVLERRAAVPGSDEER